MSAGTSAPYDETEARCPWTRRPAAFWPRRFTPDRDDPPFDRSMMDGYALRAADVPGTLAVTARIAAGDAHVDDLAPGCAAWINTGAPVPPGADAVVPVELTTGEVSVAQPIGVGANILLRGTLARAGEIVAAGRLTPERVAVCAAHGADPVTVLRRPTVAVLSTGTELQAAPGDHEIRNSNGPMLKALLRHVDIVDLGVVGDDPTALRAAIAEGLKADVLVTTGGVSKGEFDLVRPTLEGCQVEVVFHGVALQPGKPVLFGTHAGGAAFGLPGNPASALVCADLFLLPYIAALSGASFDAALATRRGRLGSGVAASPKRRRVFPCILDAGGVEPLPWRSSADLYTLTRANAYMIVEPGRDVAAGDEVDCLVPQRDR